MDNVSGLLEPLDALEVHLAKQVELAYGILASQKARGQPSGHYEDDEYRFNRWLKALRELRAATDEEAAAAGMERMGFERCKEPDIAPPPASEEVSG
jgi:hypothetical protein